MRLLSCLVVLTVFFTVVCAELPLTPSSSSPPRLTVSSNGDILDPYNNSSPVILRGFNWYLPYSSPEADGKLANQYVPGSNVVRQVGIFWDNWEGQGSGKDCRINDPSQGYLKPSCLASMDAAVKGAADAGLWSIVTFRGEYAAGQDPSHNVFTNATLKAQMLAMWTFVANHYKTFDRIAAYEIMSEPRVKTMAPGVIATFMKEGCQAVHAVDPQTPCMIGPAPYYKSWQLTDDYLLSPEDAGGPVFYTVDLFVPVSYVFSTWSDTSVYPGSFECGVAFKGWVSKFCSSSSEMLYINQTFMQDRVLNPYALGFRDRHSVPVLCNQWGINRAVNASRGRSEYIQDMLDIFEASRMHSMWWLWRWHGKQTGDNWGGFEVVHDWYNGTESIDYSTLQLFNQSWST